MPDNDDGLPRPRHRKSGRASKRGTGQPGRHLRLVTEPGPVDVLVGTYPVEDLAGMSPSAVAMLLHRATLEAESGARACPHVLITRDRETRVETRSSPFGSGLEALSAAREFLDEFRDVEPDWAFTLSIAPLLPE